jgi:geranylgeranyl diphosphate synthase type I
MTVAPAPARLTERIDELLTGFLAQQEPSLLMRALQRFVLAGGKRLRPAFCYWGWHGVAKQGSDDRAVFTAGAALELFHCFALIHDDIIDGSALRRGRPTVHEEFATWHSEHGWAGDPQLYGRNAALLCGDLCASLSVALFGQAVRQAGGPEAASALFTVTRAEAIAGEFLEITVQAQPPEDPVERALQIARMKTARYSIARPLQIGAVLGGAAEPVLAGFGQFGELLGEAFQLRDDILGVFGDPAQTGKSVLDDLRQGKPTVLLALTRARAGQDAARTLASLVGQPDLDEAGAETIREVMTSTGALDETEAWITHSFDRATQVLESLPIGDQARENLRELANFAVCRRS